MNNRDEIHIGIISLGCAKNQVDAEVMAGALTEAGYGITPDPAEAQVILVNTCGFIDEAKQEAIDTILEMAEYKKTGVCQALLVTGCLAQRYFTEIQESLPEVDGIIGIGGFKSICQAVSEVLEKGTYRNCEEDLSLAYLSGSRILFSPEGSAYLKIAEGCDNRCHYCAIPGIRGPFRSRPMEELVREAERLAAQGVKELVLIAQDTTRYGKDLYGEPKLAELIRQLNQIREFEWIRVLYLYPDEITEQLIDTIKECDKVVPYVDLPIQHICTGLLRKMNRRGSGEELRRIFSEFRARIPNVVIRTSLIIGYPGETEEDFRELMEFVQQTRFDRMGIFKYSREENTVAAAMEPQVEESDKEQRYEALMELQRRISRENNEKRVGCIYRTLVEGVDQDGIFYIGRTYAEGPEVDGNVYFTSPEPLEPGEMAEVRILIAEDYDLTGEAVIQEKGLEE